MYSIESVYDSKKIDISQMKNIQHMFLKNGGEQNPQIEIKFTNFEDWVPM